MSGSPTVAEIRMRRENERLLAEERRHRAEEERRHREEKDGRDIGSRTYFQIDGERGG